MFDKAFEHVIKWEGGYVNDPDDPGGETKFGISKSSFPDVDIESITIEDAKKIYKEHFWIQCKCDRMPYPIALLVFDSAVNMGTITAIRLLQRALVVTQDGVIGNVTLSKINLVDHRFLSIRYCSFRIMRYAALKGWKKYGQGWTLRTFDTQYEAFKT